MFWTDYLSGLGRQQWVSKYGHSFMLVKQIPANQNQQLRLRNLSSLRRDPVGSHANQTLLWEELPAQVSVHLLAPFFILFGIELLGSLCRFLHFPQAPQLSFEFHRALIVSIIFTFLLLTCSGPDWSAEKVNVNLWVKTLWESECELQMGSRGESIRAVQIKWTWHRIVFIPGSGITLGLVPVVSPSLVSPHIVLMRTNVIDLLNRVPEHDCLTFFHATQNKM